MSNIIKSACHCEEGVSPTWQSPGIIHIIAYSILRLYREIPTGLTALGMTAVFLLNGVGDMVVLLFL